MISIYYYIPDDVKRATDNSPKSIKHKIITHEKSSPSSNKLMSDINYKFGKQKLLIASYDPQQTYLISFQLLKLFLGLGLKIAKIHRIFRCKQEAVFKSFTGKNIELRKK